VLNAASKTNIEIQPLSGPLSFTFVLYLFYFMLLNIVELFAGSMRYRLALSNIINPSL